MAEGRYDDILMTMAGQLGSIDALLRELFSFLHRKTDFYIAWDPALLVSERPKMGFATGKAEELLLSAFRSFPFKSYTAALQAQQRHQQPPRQQQQQHQPTSSRSSAAAGAPQQPRSAASASTSGAVPSPPIAAAAAAAPEPAAAAAAAQRPQNAAPPPPAPPAVAPGEGAAPAPAAAAAAQQKQVPLGNGGVCAELGYYWTQTLQEVTVYVDVPKGVRGRDIACDIGAKSLSLRAMGEQVLCGALPAAVKREGSLWNLDGDDGVVVVTLEKVVKTWWACVLEGHPEIDTSRVDSTCKVGDYDEETQAAIRKIMFDQKQKQLGLPTSDDLLASQMLDKAKLAPGSPFLPGGPFAASQPSQPPAAPGASHT